MNCTINKSTRIELESVTLTLTPEEAVYLKSLMALLSVGMGGSVIAHYILVKMYPQEMQIPVAPITRDILSSPKEEGLCEDLAQQWRDNVSKGQY